MPSGVRLVVTVYDLIPLIYPEHYLPDPSYHARYKNRVELIRLADRAFAISEATGRDLVSMLDLPAEDVAVTGTGVSARFQPPAPGRDPLDAVRAHLPAVRRGYILYAGALDFRKNVDALLIAYSRLPRALRTQHQLVIVSRLTPRELDALGPRLRALDIERDVVVASAVGDDDLVPLYQAARLFVFPSLYEGFGLPVAEAIACGTPTIASDVSSLVEIVTDPAARFDPADPESLRAAIERELSDDSRPPAVLDPRHTWPSVVERMIEECARLDQIPAADGDRRASSIAALAAGEDAPWLEGGHGAARGQPCADGGAHDPVAPAALLRSALRRRRHARPDDARRRLGAHGSRVRALGEPVAGRDRALDPARRRPRLGPARRPGRRLRCALARPRARARRGRPPARGVARAGCELAAQRTEHQPRRARLRGVRRGLPPGCRAGVRRRHRRRRERGLARPRALPPARRDAHRQPGVERRRCPRASARACSGSVGDTEIRVLQRVRDDIWEPVHTPGALPGETVALVTATAGAAPGGEPAGGGRQARVGVASPSDE